MPNTMRWVIFELVSKTHYDKPTRYRLVQPDDVVRNDDTWSTEFDSSYVSAEAALMDIDKRGNEHTDYVILPLYRKVKADG